MSKTQPVSLRLTPETNTRLTTLATRLDRPKSWVIEQAVKDHMDYQAWQLEAIDAGIAPPMPGNWCRTGRLSPGWKAGGGLGLNEAGMGRAGAA